MQTIHSHIITTQAYQDSLALLREASCSLGFVAAVDPQDNYRRVWTRDGVICSLAALLSGEKDLIATAKATITTIFDHQHASGFMPSNVNPDNNRVSYGGVVGRADNPSWAVIGLMQYVLMTGDMALAEHYKNAVEKCFQVLDIWEYNGKHLIYIPQSGDWADEYIYHGYILLEQLLRVWALDLAAQVYQSEEWSRKSTDIKTVITNNYLPSKEKKPYANQLYDKQLANFKGYWMMGFNPSRVYPYFDLQANAIASLLVWDTTVDVKGILAEVLKINADLVCQFPSFAPAIGLEDDDMKQLQDNYAYHFRNIPHQFHNGGLWPVWNGFMTAALAKNGYKIEAEILLAQIHQSNAKDDNAFNECYDGVSGEGCGVKKCAWSAAGAIIGAQALAGNFLKV